MTTTKIDKPKKATSAFAKLDPVLAEKIPNINAHPEVISATQKLEELEVRLAEVHKEIDVPAPRTSPGQDAAAILDGEDLQETGAARQRLIRERDVLPKSIELQRLRIQQLKGRLVGAACTELESVVKEKVIGPHLVVFEELRKSLNGLEAFFDFLDDQGLTVDFRPPMWRITAAEIALLRGGNAFPTLEIFIEDRKKYWGLDNGKGKKV